MNQTLFLFILIQMSVLSGCANTAAVIEDPAAAALALLSTQPLDEAKQQSLRQADIVELRANSQDPAVINIERVSSLPLPDELSVRLTAFKQPVSADDNPPAVPSLSFRVASSALAVCNQSCGLPRNAAQGGAGNLLLFNCDPQGLVILREYYDADGFSGFSLSREQVNILIDDTPAVMWRMESPAGQGLTLLAWRHGDRGYSLQVPSASYLMGSQLIAIARTLPH